MSISPSDILTVVYMFLIAVVILGIVLIIAAAGTNRRK